MSVQMATPTSEPLIACATLVVLLGTILKPPIAPASAAGTIASLAAQISPLASLAMTLLTLESYLELGVSL